MQALEGTGEVQALEGAVSEQALEGAVSEQALEGAGEEQSPEGAGEVQALEGAGEEQAPEGAGEEQAPENLKPPQGWTGPAGTTEEGEGGISYSNSVSQSIKSSSMSSSPRYIISSISAVVQGAELHSALTPSTAGSLVVGIVAGPRTRSDGLGRTSDDEDELGGASRDTSGLT